MTSTRKSIPVELTRGEIEDGLRKLGLGPGDATEVHSSLSRFGKVQSGPSTVVDALMNVVGEQGTLVMSAFQVSPPIPLTETEKNKGIRWKVRLLKEDSKEKTGMGAIVEEFRTRRGVVCGTGIHRVCAWGHDAQQHSQGYQYLLDVDGWVLLLGVGIDRCSSLHLGERVPIPKEIEEYLRVPEYLRRDYPADTWEIGYEGTPDNAWQKVQQEAERRCLIKRHRIGCAECLLFKAKAVVTIYEALRRADPFGLFGVEQIESSEC